MYIIYLPPFLWYPILVGIYKKYCKSSISWAIRAYKLICLLGVTLKKDQKTWFPAYSFAWF